MLVLVLVAGAAVVATAQVGIEDRGRVLQAPPLARPAPGGSVVDPVFGTTVRRLTGATGGGGWATHVYSQLQAFSPDGAYVLLVENGDYVVRRLSNLALQPIATNTWNAPRWRPSESHTIIHYDTNADTDVTVQHTDVVSGATSDVYTLPASYRYVLANQSFDELSRDGRWMAGMVVRSDDAGVIFSVDLVARSLGAVLTVPTLYAGPCQSDPIWGEVEPDWVGVSPLGRFLVVQWPRDGDDRCSGLETFDIRTGAFVGRVSDGHQHGDLGVLPDGTNEFFMTFEFHPSGSPSVGLRSLPGAPSVQPPTYLQVLDWGNADHISCQGPEGVCLVTSGGDPSNGWTAFEAELFLQYTDGRVRRIAHHRSSSCGYWVQPRASLSRDGRFAIFASDQGVSGCGNGGLGRGEAYQLDLGGTPPTGGVTGRKLSMLARVLAPERQRLRVLSRDSGVSLGGGDGSADDPTLHGATLRVKDDSGRFDRTHALAAAGWRRIGGPGARVGYRYDDPGLVRGPIRRVLFLAGRGIKVAGKGAGLGLSLAMSPQAVEVTLSLGSRKTCMRFGGTTDWDPKGRFRAVDAAAPGGCS